MTELSSKVIFIDKRKTSMRLANAEWEAIDSICKRENIKRNNLLEMINARKDAKMGLTCSVRLFSLIYYYRLLTKEPMPRAGSSADASSPILKPSKALSERAKHSPTPRSNTIKPAFLQILRAVLCFCAACLYQLTDSQISDIPLSDKCRLPVACN